MVEPPEDRHFRGNNAYELACGTCCCVWVRPFPENEALSHMKTAVKVIRKFLIGCEENSPFTVADLLLSLC